VKIAWVVGRSGLLGSALERSLRQSTTTLFTPSVGFSWNDGAAIAADIQRETRRFADAAREASSWEVYWAAGIGTIGSDAVALVPESIALDTMVRALEQSTLSSGHGCFIFASSAGAIYAGSREPVIDERTSVKPTTPYADAKLAQEQTVRDYAARAGMRALIGRLSTLYGSRQTGKKQQGLLTHISRCIIHNRPVHIFVPLDTIRDYLSADDAAAMLIEASRVIDGPRAVMKIIASERPVTISEILSIFKRLARRPPRIVTSASATSNLYARRMQFQSIEPPKRLWHPSNLVIGISQIHSAERSRYVANDRDPDAHDR
jgi:UDP-glucose 4-epimerase